MTPWLLILLLSNRVSHLLNFGCDKDNVVNLGLDKYNVVIGRIGIVMKKMEDILLWVAHPLKHGLDDDNNIDYQILLREYYVAIGRIRTIMRKTEGLIRWVAHPPNHGLDEDNNMNCL